jgi:hypothetical protein
MLACQHAHGHSVASCYYVALREISRVLACCRGDSTVKKQHVGDDGGQGMQVGGGAGGWWAGTS